jgi:hypothetical protein
MPIHWVSRIPFERVLACVLALSVAWFSASAYFGLNSPDQQCVTAPVQTVAVAQISPCGHVMGYVERAIRPGDKGFVACKCAAKRSTTQSASGPAAISLYIPTMTRFIVPARVSVHHTHVSPEIEAPTPSLAPPYRPPAA